MLQKLIIKNYAIIDYLVFEPNKGFISITGETGAGKSIILGALSLIIGERADTSVLINKDEKCVVEAYFDVRHNEQVKVKLMQSELDVEDICLIRREISASGKSRAFINDTPVTLQVLSSVTALLVDLHQQFGHLELQDASFQLEVVDALAQNQKLFERYKKLYNQQQTIASKLNELTQQHQKEQKEADYHLFLLEELCEANFKQDEIEHAEIQLKQWSNAERVVAVLNEAKQTISEGEQPMLASLKKTLQQIQNIVEVLPGAASVSERMLSVYEELKDIAHEMDELANQVVFDPEALEQLNERMNLGYRLFKKHQVSTTSDLLAIQLKLEEKQQFSFGLEEQINKLTQEFHQVHEEATKLANQLSHSRKNVIGSLAEKINHLLKLVGMPNAVVSIECKQQEKLTEFGIDQIQFLLDANKSGQSLPIYKATSGGEMSRIMLCIKSLIAAAMHLPTLIFDEVDTGISGEAAMQVGILLNQLGQSHQIICITHQPQVAAKGNQHFYVYKEQGNDEKITTKMRLLSNEERVNAIASMIGGFNPSQAAMQNASELLMGK